MGENDPKKASFHASIFSAVGPSGTLALPWQMAPLSYTLKYGAWKSAVSGVGRVSPFTAHTFQT